MKARKFWKKALQFKYFLAFLIVVILAVLLIVLWTVKIAAHHISLDEKNMEFTSEDFKDFYGVPESACDKNKFVGENDKYKMFIDENTTIVSVCVKNTLKPGRSGEVPEDYRTVYTSGKDPEGAEGEAAAANFELEYASTDIAKQFTSTMNSYNDSVYFNNKVTGEYEKHYQIKYLDNAVQVYYTIGNFGSSNKYFSQQYYATVYKPARVDSDGNEKKWKKAIRDYENGYLKKVGNLASTFEERFRGNVQITITRQRPADSAVGEDRHCTVLYLSQTIRVFSQDARDYLFGTVLPEIWEDHDMDPAYMPEGSKVLLGIIDDEVLSSPDPSAEHLSRCLDEHYKNDPDCTINTNQDIFKNRYWNIDVPIDLIQFDGKDGYFKKYFNNPDSPLTSNPFLVSADYEDLKSQYTEVKANGKNVIYPYYKSSFSGTLTSIYNLLYLNEPYYYPIGAEKMEILYKNPETGVLKPFTSCGYPARDADGNFLYDDDGFVQRQIYNEEIVKDDNSKFDIKTAGLPVFRLALEFKLADKLTDNGDGLLVSLIRKSIYDSSNVDPATMSEDDYKLLNTNNVITRIKICNNMTSVDDTQQGYIIVPDGAGAIINFNSWKTDTTVSAVYYGDDNAYPPKLKSESKAQLLLGMFGFVITTPENEGGMIAAIEKGGGQIELTASVNESSKNNNAYFLATLRDCRTVVTGTVTNPSPYLKKDTVLCPSDIVYHYLILEPDETEYWQVAKRYQSYLMQRYGLEKKDKTDKVINNIDFIGTFEKYTSFIGIKYTVSDTLTTFKQAEAIIDELNANGVNNLSVSYEGWTNEYLEYEVGGRLKVARKLGKTAGMRKFYEFCADKQIPFYPELQIATAKGYDYLMGSIRYSSRGVGNNEAIQYDYNLASLRMDKKKGSRKYFLAPLYYHDVTQKLLKDYQKLKIWPEKNEYGGFYLSDIGNQWSGNYRKKKQVYGYDSLLYQEDVMDMISAQGKIKIATPCDYAFPYVDEAINVPVDNKKYLIYDRSIPFYQLVVSGLFDYTTNLFNGPDFLNDRGNPPYEYYFLKALETGSNFSFMFSAEDPQILLKTNYTQYFNIYYDRIKDFVIAKTKEIDDLGIHECYLEQWESLTDHLSQVTYVNKQDPAKQIVLIINPSNYDDSYHGIPYAKYSYRVVNTYKI